MAEFIIKNDPLRDKTFLFAIRIVNLYRYLADDKKEYVLSKQVLRSGTNPGAMVREAANAESGADFIHKLAVALKETGETQYWLELLLKTNYLSESEFQSINADSIEVLKLLTSSIVTKKKKMALKVSATIAALLVFLVLYINIHH
jgi:four helix bundle protein